MPARRVQPGMGDHVRRVRKPMPVQKTVFLYRGLRGRGANCGKEVTVGCFRGLDV